MGESSGEGLWLLALVTGGKWHVTCYLWHVTFFFCKKCQREQLVDLYCVLHLCISYKQRKPESIRVWETDYREVTKSAKNANNWIKSAQKCGNCQKEGFRSICATICTRRDNQCILYAGWLLFFFLFFFFTNNVVYTENNSNCFSKKSKE